MGDTSRGNGCGFSIWGKKNARKRKGAWSAKAGLESSPRSSVFLKRLAGSWEGAKALEGN